MKAYKGFNRDLTCRGFKYEQGKTYETDKSELCKCGFHACEQPLDVFKYYPPASSVYHEVKLDGVCGEQEENDDSKVCAKKITIGAKLSISDLVAAQVQYVREHCKTQSDDARVATAGDSGAVTAGHYGAATAGDYGAVTAGHYGAATAGDCGVATAGYYGAATAGDCGVATAGYRGAVTAGHYGAATAGAFGVATAGDSGVATAGNRGAVTAGHYGAATAGDCGVATAGDYGISTAGDSSVATAGDYGIAASRGRSAVGTNGVAVARGMNTRAKGGMGAVLVLAEENECSFEPIAWKAAVVDGNKIKPDTWYKLNDGEFVEAEE